MPFYVERTRTRERRGHLLGQPSAIGAVEYSQTFAVERSAEIEAKSWADTGSWSVRVVEGRSPAEPKRQARR